MNRHAPLLENVWSLVKCLACDDGNSFCSHRRWDYNIPGMVDAAKALADLQAKGLIKHVGLTNMVSKDGTGWEEREACCAMLLVYALTLRPTACRVVLHAEHGGGCVNR